jgi:opacity protein-like surface antigen
MKVRLVFAMLMITCLSAFAQEKRINIYSAYVFDDKFETVNSTTDYYRGKIIGGLQWGAGLEFIIKDQISAELMYLHQDTQAPVESYYTVLNNKTYDLGVSYALLGISRIMKKDKVEPYGGLLLGAAIFNNKNPSPGEETSKVKFALGFRLGATIWVSDRVGIKLQTQFLTSVQGIGGGFYFGTGGTGAGASTYSTITQFTLGGGLAFKLGSAAAQ